MFTYKIVYNRNRILGEHSFKTIPKVGEVFMFAGLNYCVKCVGLMDDTIYVSPDNRVRQVHLNSAVSERLDEILTEFNFVYTADGSRKDLRGLLEAIVVGECIKLDDDGSAACYFDIPKN